MHYSPKVFAYGLFGLLLSVMAFVVPRESFTALIALWLGLNLLWYLLYSKSDTVSDLKLALFWGYVFRILLLFATPWLTDDFYRFIWDGLLLNEGLNPFAARPSEVLNTNDLLSKEGFLLANELYPQLNSPEYYSIYPPIVQWISGVSVLTGMGSIKITVFLMKLSVLISEIATIEALKRLVKRFEIKPKAILLYVLNPLVIIELCGNLHFEAIMIACLLWTIIYLDKGKMLAASFWFAVAVAVKLIPLLFLPAIWMRVGNRKFLRFAIVFSSSICFFFLPLFLGGTHLNFMESFLLYFKSFEFNASIYYVWRALKAQVSWETWSFVAFQVFPAIVAGAAVVIAYLFRSGSVQRLVSALLLTYIVYLLFARIVHPWYLTPLLAFAVLSQNRAVVLWACLAPLSYYAYMTTTYTENMLVLAVEYVPVIAVLIYDLLKRDKASIPDGGESLVTT